VRDVEDERALRPTSAVDRSGDYISFEEPRGRSSSRRTLRWRRSRTATALSRRRSLSSRPNMARSRLPAQRGPPARRYVHRRQNDARLLLEQFAELGDHAEQRIKRRCASASSRRPTARVRLAS
jgi:hypothetical protein